MNEFVNPKGNAKPAGAYSHTVKVPANAEWLIISGQVGIDAKGKLQASRRNSAFAIF